MMYAAVVILIFPKRSRHFSDATLTKKIVALADLSGFFLPATGISEFYSSRIVPDALWAFAALKILVVDPAAVTTTNQHMEVPPQAGITNKMSDHQQTDDYQPKRN